MPELPDIEAYIRALRQRIVNRTLDSIAVYSPSLLRTAIPPLESIRSVKVTGLQRLGKRIVFELPDNCFLVLHLMIAGRLVWSEQKPKGVRPGGKATLALFQFDNGFLQLTEASSKKRCTLHIVEGESALAALAPSGVEPLNCTIEEFSAALVSENRTLKRALTNPKTFSGIGNAYSDEILHAARLSPLTLTRKLKPDEISELYSQTQRVLTRWLLTLTERFATKFPTRKDITAFRPEFAVHGKFGEPCPDCGLPVQRIRYADNETNYCAKCQTGGKILADRAMSRLLKGDRPTDIDEL